MTWRRDGGVWVREPDEVHRCPCGALVRRCCEGCVRGRCPDCGERVAWTGVETERVDVVEGQATLAMADGGGQA